MYTRPVSYQLLLCCACHLILNPSCWREGVPKGFTHKAGKAGGILAHCHLLIDPFLQGRVRMVPMTGKVQGVMTGPKLGKTSNPRLLTFLGRSFRGPDNGGRRTVVRLGDLLAQAAGVRMGRSNGHGACY